MRRFSIAAASAAALAAAAADLEWKWDVSGRTDPEPAAAVADIASVLPSTASAANAAQTDTFVYDWLDSAGFDFDGLQPGMIMMIR